MTFTIVVVDDDPDILEFLDDLLSLEGIRVVVSDYTGDVVRLIRQMHPDVVLLDLQTKADKHAGIRVLEQLRSHWSTATIRVILMSADPWHLHRCVAQLRDIRTVALPKPFTREELLSLVRNSGPN